MSEELYVSTRDGYRKGVQEAREERRAVLKAIVLDYIANPNTLLMSGSWETSSYPSESRANGSESWANENDLNIISKFCTSRADVIKFETTKNNWQSRNVESFLK
jgi:hypothetical protein